MHGATIKKTTSSTHSRKLHNSS